jgi:beta-lactamase regulating signal transducer with metallopeptidase domain
VAETPEITGAGAAAELTETLSKVAVVKAVVLPLFTARPTYTFWAMVMVWFVPNCTQFSPSEETKLLNVFPVLLTFSQ